MTLDAELLFAHTSDGVVELDDQLRIVRANDRASLLLRRPAAQLVGLSASKFLSPTGDKQNSAMLKLAEAIKSSVPLKFEAFLPGLFAWHSIMAVPQKGTLTCFVRDITDRVRREQDEAVKAIVRNITEDLPIAIVITRGPGHRVELVNNVVRRMWSDRPLEGELVERILPESTEQGFISLLDSVYASGKRFEGQEMTLSWDPDGSGTKRQSIFNLIYQPLFGASGEVNGIVHVGINVTDLVTARQLTALQAAERAAVLDQLSEGVIITDASGKITFVNKAAKQLHGLAVLGVAPEGYTTAYRLLTIDGAPHPIDELPLTRAVANNEPTTEAKWKIRRPDGTEVLVIGGAKPVLDDHGNRIACVLTMHEVVARAEKQ
ncbi:MAG: hypothetical protein NVS2B4_06430 [Ramlibacter sp.]